MTSEMTGGMKQKYQVIQTDIAASWLLHGDHRAHLSALAAVFSSFSTVFLPPPLLPPLLSPHSSSSSSFEMRTHVVQVSPNALAWRMTLNFCFLPLTGTRYCPQSVQCWRARQEPHAC